MIIPGLRDSLATLDLANTAICLHTSMRAFSPRVAPRDLVDTLQSIGATLLAPAFTYHFEVAAPETDRPPQNGMRYRNLPTNPAGGAIFSATENSLSLADMGVLPQTLLQTPGRARGNHPLNSFVSIGPLASGLIAGQTPEDVYAPFRELIKAQGKILLIGTDSTSLTLVHYAEMQSGRQLFIRWAHDHAGRIIRTRVGSCSAGFGSLMPLLLEQGKVISWQGARLVAADAGSLLAALRSAIEANPEITRCADSACLRCADALLGGPQS